MPAKKKPSTYWARVVKDLVAQRDAALAGQRTLQKRLDEANAQNTAHENYAARLRAEHDKAVARLRTETEDTVMRYATRENELRNDLAECVKTLRASGWQHSLARGWQRESVIASEAYGESPGMKFLEDLAARQNSAMHELRATPFGHVACVGIVRAIAAYLNPRCGSDLSGANADVPASAPPAAPPRDR